MVPTRTEDDACILRADSFSEISSSATGVVVRRRRRHHRAFFRKSDTTNPSSLRAFFVRADTKRVPFFFEFFLFHVFRVFICRVLKREREILSFGGNNKNPFIHWECNLNRAALRRSATTRAFAPLGGRRREKRERERRK